MQPLRSVLMALAERPDVAGAVVVSDDGLVVEASLPGGARRRGTRRARHQRRPAAIGGARRRGPEPAPWAQAAVESSHGTLVLQRLPSGATLLVLAAPDGDLGTLLYDLRRHAPALVSLL